MHGKALSVKLMAKPVVQSPRIRFPMIVGLAPSNTEKETRAISESVQLMMKALLYCEMENAFAEM
jgi:hypothetical protein